MLEKFSQIAEQAATNASRRQFLGRLGKGALATAGIVAGYLAFGSSAAAARRQCASDANCPTGQICVGGLCVKGVRACSAGSAGQCRGRPVGSVCGTRNRPGRCTGAPNCRCA